MRGFHVQYREDLEKLDSAVLFDYLFGINTKSNAPRLARSLG